jgi:hypothetical protein
VKPRGVEFILAKKNPGPYWDKLLSTNGKPKWLKVDWNKWKEEDELDEQDEGFNDVDFSSFGGGEGADLVC